MEVCSHYRCQSTPRDHFVDGQGQAMCLQELRFRMAWRKPWQIPTANPIKEALRPIEATSQASVACMIQVLGTFGRYLPCLLGLEAFPKDVSCTLKDNEADNSTVAVHRLETFSCSRTRIA